MINIQNIKSYTAGDLSCEDELKFLDEIEKWAFMNCNDEVCLKLWWDKTNEIYHVSVKYNYEAAIELLGLANVMAQNHYDSSAIH